MHQDTFAGKHFTKLYNNRTLSMPTMKTHYRNSMQFFIKERKKCKIVVTLKAQN